MQSNLKQLQYIIRKEQRIGKSKKIHHELKCDYCGNIYKNMAYCHDVDGDICCYLCNMIVAYKPKYSHNIIIAKSSKSQLSIITDTTNYIIENKTAPSVNEIDGTAEIIKIQPTKFYKHIEDYQNCKIFFSQSIDVSKIFLGIIVDSPQTDMFNMSLDMTNDNNEISKKDLIINLIKKWNVDLKNNGLSYNYDNAPLVANLSTIALPTDK